MTRMLRALLVLCSASVSIVLVKATGAQDNFPSRPIKLIVPFPAGGGIDVTARITAQALGNMLGQQVIVQNEGGAGGAIATDSVVKSEPDGYTLLYHSTTGIVHAAVTEKLPYTWLNDLAPVSIVTRFAPVMIVSPTLAVKDLREFIALLKNNPGKYSFASSGTGTAVHLAEEMFKQKASVDIVHIPYRGTAAAMPDLLTGRIAMMIDGVPVQTQNIRNGTVRALAEDDVHRLASVRGDCGDVDQPGNLLMCWHCAAPSPRDRRTPRPDRA